MERLELVADLPLDMLWKLQVYHCVIAKRELALEFLFLDSDALEYHGELAEDVGVDVGCDEDAECGHDCLDVVAGT